MSERALLLLVACFLVGFLGGQWSTIEIAGYPTEQQIFAEFFPNHRFNYQWGANTASAYKLSYGQGAAPGKALGRVPLNLVVNFWNPVSRLNRSELEAVLAGNITNWRSLGGDNLPIKVVAYTGEDYSRLTAFAVSPFQVVATQQEMVAAVASDRGALGVLTWPALRPQVKVLTLEGINPAWVQSRQELENYPLWTDLILTPPRTKVKDWFSGKLWLALRFRRRLGQSFSPTKLLWGRAPLILATAGDIMLDREVAKTSIRKGDYRYPFLKTASIFRRSSLAFANLESPVSDQGRQLNMFRADPRFLEGLLYAGFDIVSLANNHIMDYGAAALIDTMKRLEEQGLLYVGVGRNLHQARQGCLLALNGLKVGFLAYTELGPGFTYTREPQHWAATSELPGVVPAREDYIREDVSRMKKEADLVFLSMHWGKEYQRDPTEQQRLLGRTALAAGADLVLGHHPHVIQGLEFGSKGLIAYSLGNFIFDQLWEATKQGLILEAACDRQGLKQIRLTPIMIREEQPVVAEGAPARQIMQEVASVSQGLNN